MPLIINRSIAQNLMIGAVVLSLFSAFAWLPSNSFTYTLKAVAGPNGKQKLAPGDYSLKFSQASISSGTYEGLELEFCLPGEPTYDEEIKLVATLHLPSTKKLYFSQNNAGKARQFFCSPDSCQEPSAFPLTASDQDYPGHFDIKREVRGKKSVTYPNQATFGKFQLTIHQLSINNNQLTLHARVNAQTDEQFRQTMQMQYALNGEINLNGVPVRLKLVD